METLSCHCGIVVFEADALDETGLCVVCAGTGHDFGCACVECWVYLERCDLGDDPGTALEAAIRSAGTSAGSGSR
jgi:hypothetical protein